MSTDDSSRRFLVTGGNGFIGSYVAKALFEKGNYVRIADIKRTSYFNECISNEVLVGNLCDLSFCESAVRSMDTVLHFAATMGGMGAIHEANDFVIYKDNSAMTFNLVHAAVHQGVQRFFYASSACVYPTSLQHHAINPVSLREQDLWSSGAPNPQGLYGLEKLNSELLLMQFAEKMQIRIARFHNIFGPYGAWVGGHEKVPAAQLRKALAAQMDPTAQHDIEIWGDGKQRRSFLYIDNCVEAILLLIESDCSEPINIGSDCSVTIDDLTRIAAQSAGLNVGDFHFRYVDDSRPIGVHSRNSNNEFVMRSLNWTPKITLEAGMMKTAEWIRGEMENMLNSNDEISARTKLLHSFKTSEVVFLHKPTITFAILLPITSRGLEGPEKSLDNLRTFAQSLARTTWRDTRELGLVHYQVKIYLGIDADDDFLLRHAENCEKLNIESLLSEEGITDVSTEICDVPRGHVCAIWRQCAYRAWQENADYFVLMGDDVNLFDEGWMRDIHEQFTLIAQHEQVPQGMGCVAFTDVTFPGMPTFPVIHRTHMDVFEGQVIPDVFVNQDGDPFLFQLYRKWGCSRMIPSRLSNGIGGSLPARYTQQHADGWTFGPLDKAALVLARSLPDAARKMTLDIIIPSYRVQLPFLDPILALKESPTCETMFIIIIDNPHSPKITELEAKYAHRPDVRIRVNKSNLGASASRNRGMKESAADWILFLDDDVTPQADILIEAEKIIRLNPQAAGFIGNTYFPVASTIFTNAVHLAGVTFFWDIAAKMPQNESDMPWGVTANLIARRVQDDVEFDLQFPKTGGGEDIDFCRKKRDFSVAHGGEGFYPAPHVVATHPWWNGGQRSYWRFYMWSKGDGGLIKLYPNLTYLDHSPNSAELFLISTALTILGAFTYLFTRSSVVFNVSVSLAIATVIANIAHDVYRHLWRDTNRTKSLRSSLRGLGWVVAVAESALIRMASEGGRLIGLLERGEILLIGQRFDWFTGRKGDGPMNEEIMNGRQRMALVVLITGVFFLGARIATVRKVAVERINCNRSLLLASYSGNVMIIYSSWRLTPQPRAYRIARSMGGQDFTLGT
ncbi:glycosyltransferase family 2 protein [Suillus clintonianus]|uniref:glycosyltransferase family 2 protein n=1 Tax=Suillus clintonianus TaxID=1904413 RepID=UPI001B87099A|nr:glycosyltransferase family 2 protein [Suillus clintonianus]KAG2143095.1 glycosyltransferase family 2 protein [Suillus clintonianus]